MLEERRMCRMESSKAGFPNFCNNFFPISSIKHILLEELLLQPTNSSLCTKL